MSPSISITDEQAAALARGESIYITDKQAAALARGESIMLDPPKKKTVIAVYKGGLAAYHGQVYLVEDAEGSQTDGYRGRYTVILSRSGKEYSGLNHHFTPAVYHLIEAGFTPKTKGSSL